MLAFQPISRSQILYPSAIIHLIERKWQNQLGYAGGQCFGYGANSTMVHHRAGSGEYLLKRSEFDVTNIFRKVRRKLGSKFC